MRRSPWSFIIAGAALGACFASTAHASYPAGVWVRVASVAFEPTEANATRIRIGGAAMLYDGSTSGPYVGYTSPALGYLYYECPAGKEATCLLEWQDIKNNIALPPDQCVGLGNQSLPTGSLRANGTPPANPDAYPISMGVLTGFSPCQVLAGFLASQPDAGAGGAGSSSSSSGGTGASGGSTPGTTTTTTTTTTDNTGGTKGSSDTPDAGASSSCTIRDGESASAFGAALAMLGLTAALARLGARRRR